MITIHKNHHSLLFIFHRPGCRTAWINDGKRFLRFVYLTDGFRYVRTQSYLPCGVLGEPFELSPQEVASLQREVVRHHLNLKFFASQQECILYALPVNAQQTVYDLFPPAGSITAAGITTRRNPPRWSERGNED
jgi:hypothetical protein